MAELISVITLTYNQEKTIGRALDSILRQRCHLPIEVVIGEDGSTDGTRAICEDYARRFPGVIRLMPKAPNKGIARNYFDCLLACRGRYIADCAGDDRWTDPLKLEKEVDVLEREPDVTLVHTAWVYQDERTGKTSAPPPAPFPAPRTEGRQMLEAIVTQTDRPVIHSCTSLYRAEAMLRAYRERPDFYRDASFGCEDMQVAFALAARGTVAYLPDVTLAYSVGAPTASHRADSAGQFRFVMGVTRLSHLLCRHAHLDSPATRRYFRRRAFALKMHAFRAHDELLSRQAARLRREWGVRLTPAMALLDLVTAIPVAWRAGLWARRLLVRLKGHRG